jgi:endonuclease-8
MPEGHLLHRLARDHAAAFAGHPVAVSSPQGRFAAEAAQLDGTVLEGTDAYGKYLLHHYEGGRTVVVHLGRRGLFLAFPAPAPDPRPQVRLRVTGPALAADLIAPLTCALRTPEDVARLVAGLGPDPLRDDADADLVWRRLSATRRPLGAVLLDQAVLAGIGNVFRAEALFLLGIAPTRPASALSREDFDRLWALLVRLLRAGVEAGRIVSVDGAEPDARWVYKRERCRRCGTPVLVRDVGGRTAYWCPRDQPG